jgi:hypothetical protein
VLLVIGLALLAALLFATSDSLQQHSAHDSSYAPEVSQGTPHQHRPVVLPALITLLRTLVRRRLWLAGWLINLVSFVVQAAALQLGSVALVQPILVTQLLFSLPLASAWCHRWPQRRDWLSGLAISGGLAVFLAVRGAAPLKGEPNRAHVVIAGLSIFIAVAVLMLASARRRPLVHATLVAIAAGLCFAISAVLMKLTTADLLMRGVGATARDWVGYALAVSTLGGLLLEQGAFAAGSLPAAVAAITITNPLTSYLLGILAFHVKPPSGLGLLSALAGAGLLISVGAVGLAHSPIVRTGMGRDSTPRTRAPADRHSG